MGVRVAFHDGETYLSCDLTYFLFAVVHKPPRLPRELILAGLFTRCVFGSVGCIETAV